MKVRIVKSILWFIVGAAAMVGLARFYRGLGPTTAMSDVTPWGFWIGFDVLCGVALAAGGFVIAATVYVFRREEYRPIVRPAVLTAFLGYIAVVGGLIFDLGLPWNIWHMIIHWQHHSALFEVGWCVMLYLTVLALEFSPVVLEKSPFHKLYKIMKSLALPLVILGIMLSFLHQSSLGTLFLIMPFRIHPLWYSSIMPVLFFVSAVGLGLGMVCMESLLSSWLYDREVEKRLLGGLARAAVYVLGLYLVLRIGDLAVQGNLGLVFEGSWESSLFILEIGMGVIFPMILFALPKARGTVVGLAMGATCVVLGIVLNRLTVGGIAMITNTGSIYLPSWMELLVSAGVVSAATLAFLFFVEHFKVYDEEALKSEALGDLPMADPVSQARTGGAWAPAWHQYSLACVLAMSLVFALLPDDVVQGAQPQPVPVQAPRLVYAVKTPPQEGMVSSYAVIDTARDAVPQGSELTDVLLLDGDRNGNGVFFPHEAHKMHQGGADSCSMCHHMNKPLDRATSCHLCHSDMFSPRDTFDHDFHVVRMGGNDACTECHTDRSEVKNRQTTTACLDCHGKMQVAGSFVEPDGSLVLDWAPSYKDAMHGLCIGCHAANFPKEGEMDPELARCSACHREKVDPRESELLIPHGGDGEKGK